MPASSTGATVLGRFACLAKPSTPLLVQGMEHITDSVDRTAHELRHRLRQHPTGTGEHDWRTTDTEGVRSAPIGFPLETLIIGQRSKKERWFPSPRIPREIPMA